MPFDHNDHYHRLLLRQLPPGCRTALDVGCGTGRFARRLAERGIEVDAVDRSAEVLALAQRQPVHAPGSVQPRYQCADIARMELPVGRYDYISCLASLHHVPFEVVTRLRAALAPGGVLAVLGCYAERGTADLAWGLAAVPVNAAARLTVAAAERLRPGATGAGATGAGATGAGAVRPPVAQPEMELSRVRREAAALLPGSTVRRLLLWRYLLVHRADGAVTR